ncbi:hypothetical protein GWI33_005083 [Rhynchophorus ferrugineus]|uniref:Uncharacterized protein n=1 Tax=Rhynchophorus ferrugineus TaxID=354439 RepID=A0A834MGB0_RHYFE|nr:hypothetical protein GWI33_005083 [Rhynchophorus ferrugineus]
MSQRDATRKSDTERDDGAEREGSSLERNGTRDHHHLSRPLAASYGSNSRVYEIGFVMVSLKSCLTKEAFSCTQSSRKQRDEKKVHILVGQEILSP